MSTQNINPKPCVYNCGIQIYWNTSVNEYWEFFSQKKHICPNKINKPTTTTYQTIAGTTTSNTKPTYYSKNPGPLLPNQKCLTHLNICKIQ